MTAIPSAAAFHRHLDHCQTCNAAPDRLCLVGYALLSNPANRDDMPEPEPFIPTMARAPEIVEGVE